MNRKYITVVVVVVLCVVAFGFSKGWFSPSSPSSDTQSNKDSANQALDQDQANEDVAEVAETTTEPTGTAAE